MNKTEPVGGGDALLRIEGLCVQFSTAAGKNAAVRDVSFGVAPGEVLGIVGESGSGKSVSIMSVMGLIPDPPGKRTAGRIFFEGRELSAMGPRELNQIRGNEIAMIFQEPMTSLNPIHTCGRQIMEPLILHGGCSKKAAAARALELMGLVGIPIPQRRMKEYPHQLSGGMRQRVMIAMALACRPKLLIADEPTTALDVTIQAQILELMKDLQQEFNSAIILVTHDLGVVAGLCHRVIVMYDGQIVEDSPIKQLFSNPCHPYSEGLLRSIPTIGKSRRRLHSIPGTVPNPFEERRGCSFEPRCEYATDHCRIHAPLLEAAGENRSVRCWRWREIGNQNAAE